MNNYVFHANMNPATLPPEETKEYIEIKIPADNENTAWKKLACLVGCRLAKLFRLDDEEMY